MGSHFDVIQKQSPNRDKNPLQLSYPYVVQRLVKIVALIHEVVTEPATRAADTAAPVATAIHWRGRGDAWLVVPRRDDATETPAQLEERIIKFLQGEVARNGREMCLVTSDTSCIHIRQDGRLEPSDKIPQEGLLLLISSMEDG
ncbi:MAG: hypothetical protein RIQ81_171 [Pseudomonadota bacterium]|jgi:hypothetical protein